MKRFILLFVIAVICTSAIFSQNIKNIYWKNSSENEETEAIVIAEVTEADNNQLVTIEIFPAGKKVANCAPYSSFEVPVKDGEAKAVWKFQRGTSDPALKQNPKYIAIARYGAQTLQTKVPLEIKLNRITVKNLKWLDENEKPVRKNVMGDVMICSAEVDGDLDKATVKIHDVNTGKNFANVELPVQNNMVYLSLAYGFDGMYLEKKPVLVFEIEAPGIEPVKSVPIEVSMTYRKRITYEDGEPLDDIPYKVILMNGKIIEGKTDKNGMIIIENLVPGDVYLYLEDGQFIMP